MEERKVVKKFTGFKEPQADEQFSHVIMDREQYDNYLDIIRSLEDKCNKLKKDIDDINAQTIVAIDKVNAEAHSQIMDAKKETKQWQDRFYLEENKNKNLIRLARERANAERKLQPKKERSGYIIQTMDQNTYTFSIQTSRKINRIEKVCWKVKLQTPWNSLMTFTVAKKNTEDDFKNILGKSFGISRMFSNIEFSNEKDLNTLWSSQDNFMFAPVYKLNAVRGFWEIEFYTRYSLNITPDVLATKQKSS